MKLSTIRDLLGAEVLTGEVHLDENVNKACGCDLMSDVLRYAKENAVLLTGLVNRQVFNTVDLSNMHSVIFVRNKRPDEELLELADDIDVLVMTTRIPMFEACGILYKHGLSGTNYEL